MSYKVFDGVDPDVPFSNKGVLEDVYIHKSHDWMFVHLDMSDFNHSEVHILILVGNLIVAANNNTDDENGTLFFKYIRSVDLPTDKIAVAQGCKFLKNGVLVVALKMADYVAPSEIEEEVPGSLQWEVSNLKSSIESMKQKLLRVDPNMYCIKKIKMDAELNTNEPPKVETSGELPDMSVMVHKKFFKQTLFTYKMHWPYWPFQKNTFVFEPVRVVQEHDGLREAKIMWEDLEAIAREVEKEELIKPIGIWTLCCLNVKKCVKKILEICIKDQ